jgi:small subunit ribosomal protein S20
MPITKSAIKANKQNQKQAKNNKHFKSKMKTLIKGVTKMVKTDHKKAETMLSAVYSAIDTCYKKNLIQKNNAARKKSKVSKLLISSSPR